MFDDKNTRLIAVAACISLPLGVLIAAAVMLASFNNDAVIDRMSAPGFQNDTGIVISLSGPISKAVTYRVCPGTFENNPLWWYCRECNSDSGGGDETRHEQQQTQPPPPPSMSQSVGSSSSSRVANTLATSRRRPGDDCSCGAKYQWETYCPVRSDLVSAANCGPLFDKISEWRARILAAGILSILWILPGSGIAYFAVVGNFTYDARTKVTTVSCIALLLWGGAMIAAVLAHVSEKSIMNELLCSGTGSENVDGGRIGSLSLAERQFEVKAATHGSTIAVFALCAVILFPCAIIVVTALTSVVGLACEGFCQARERRRKEEEQKRRREQEQEEREKEQERERAKEEEPNYDETAMQNVKQVEDGDTDEPMTMHTQVTS